MSLFRALRHRNYRLFFMGQGLSLVGTWIQQTGEVWLAYRLTHSAFALGVFGGPAWGREGRGGNVAVQGQ